MKSKAIALHKVKPTWNGPNEIVTVLNRVISEQEKLGWVLLQVVELRFGQSTYDLLAIFTSEKRIPEDQENV